MKSYIEQVKDLLRERGIDVNQYELQDTINMEADFKGSLFVFKHKINKDFQIQVGIDKYRGKIAYYTITI